MIADALEKRAERRIEDAKAFGKESQALHTKARNLGHRRQWRQSLEKHGEATAKHRAAMRRYDRAAAIYDIIRRGFVRIESHGVIQPAAA